MCDPETPFPLGSPALREKAMADKCTLCDDLPIAVFSMPGGCYCHPEIKVQRLCPQHIVRCHPLNGMYLIEDLRLDKSFPVPDLDLPASPIVQETDTNEKQTIRP